MEYKIKTFSTYREATAYKAKHGGYVWTECSTSNSFTWSNTHPFESIAAPDKFEVSIQACKGVLRSFNFSN